LNDALDRFIEVGEIDDDTLTNHCDCCCVRGAILPRFPECCSCNDSFECVFCYGECGFGCFTCLSEERKGTKSCRNMIFLHRCCDYMNENEFVICEDQAVVFACCCCMKGTGRFWCGLNKGLQPCDYVFQHLCCVCRCNVPMVYGMVCFDSVIYKPLASQMPPPPVHSAVDLTSPKSMTIALQDEISDEGSMMSELDHAIDLRLGSQSEPNPIATPKAEKTAATEII